jgi:hypothetical protein
MLNAANKNIALAIASAYCNNNTVCKESLFNRLNQYLNDSSFPNFLSDLPSRKYGVAQFRLPLIKHPYQNVYAGKIFMMDLVDGSSGEWPFFISGEKYNPSVTDWKKSIEGISIASLRFEYIVGNQIVYSSNEHGGYPISYTTDPTISGGYPGGGYPGGGDPGGGDPGGGDPGGGDPGGGKIIVENGNPSSPITVQPVMKVFSGFDYQNLLIPGVIILAAYFFIGKK